MIDLTQLILLFVTLILTILLVGFAIYAFIILKNIKQALDRFNQILSNIEQISDKLKEPSFFLASFLHGLKATFSIVDNLRSKKHQGEILLEIKKEAEEILGEIGEHTHKDSNLKTTTTKTKQPDSVSNPIGTTKSQIRKFFKRN